MALVNFEQVSAEEFAKLANAKPASKAFKAKYGRYEPQTYGGEDGPHYMVHRGPLHVTGNFAAPGFCTLITGDLTVDGFVDLNNPEGFDEGGVFVVLGNLSCRAFANHYGKCSIIDGNLHVDDIIVNSFEDSTLVVIKNLRTKFFLGRDLWAEVGGRAQMTYGDGYCLPVGYTDAEQQAVEPEHDRDTSVDLLNVEDPDDIDILELLNRIRSGKPIFKS